MNVSTAVEYWIQSKYPSSTGGLTDWHYYATPFSEEDGYKRVLNLRADFAATQPDRQFRLICREITVTTGDWTEVDVDAPR